MPLGPRRSSPWGHEARGGCARVDGGRHAVHASHWGLRWWGHETGAGCAKVERGGMRFMPLGPSVELPSFLWGYDSVRG
eukprot:149349-Pyramimonas_sp.AAC.1